MAEWLAKRAEIIGVAYRRYHAGEITLAELLRCVTEMRVTPPEHPGRN